MEKQLKIIKKANCLISRSDTSIILVNKLGVRKVFEESVTGIKVDYFESASAKYVRSFQIQTQNQLTIGYQSLIFEICNSIAYYIQEGLL